MPQPNQTASIQQSLVGLRLLQCNGRAVLGTVMCVVMGDAGTQLIHLFQFKDV